MAEPKQTWRVSSLALSLGVCFGALVAGAACDSDGPTAPTPPTTSSIVSTASTTSTRPSSTTSASTTSASTTTISTCLPEDLGTFSGYVNISGMLASHHGCEDPDGHPVVAYFITFAQPTDLLVDATVDISHWILLLNAMDVVIAGGEIRYDTGAIVASISNYGTQDDLVATAAPGRYMIALSAAEPGDDDGSFQVTIIANPTAGTSTTSASTTRSTTSRPTTSRTTSRPTTSRTTSRPTTSRTTSRPTTSRTTSRSTTSSTTSRSTTTTVTTGRCFREQLGDASGGLNRFILDALEPDCVSPNFFGPYARYYTFRTTRSVDLTVTMTSIDIDSFLLLRRGDSFSGAQVAYDDDGAGGLDAEISFPGLGPGTYTIEATSALVVEEGAFFLTIDVAPARSTTTSRRTTSSTTSRRTTTRTTTSISNSRRVVFELDDACYDGRRTEYRFFLYEGSRKVGVWPAANQFYRLSDGGSRTHTLDPSQPGKVCYGARSENDPSGSYWGVGIDGNQGCDDCCVQTSETRIVYHPGVRLSC